TVDALTLGQEEVREFTVTLSDGSTTTVTITITGTDDLPIISDAEDAVTEGDLTPVTGTLTATDADNPDLAFNANTIDDPYGTFVVNADGSWTFDLADNDTVDALTLGQEEIREFTVTLSDGSTTTVTITITGTDDLPVISSDADRITEGDSAILDGTLTASDADNPDLAFNANTINDPYGTFVVNADGSWTFDLADNDTVDALTLGQEEVREFTVTLSDGSTTTVTITITGTDDLPIISDAEDAVTEGDLTPVTGTLIATDADNPDLAFNANTIDDAYGTFVVNADGSWTFDLANNATVDALTLGQEEIREFTVTLSDGSTTTVTITITGTDDLPEISSDADRITEGDSAILDGTLIATDADNPDLAFNANTIDDPYGTFVVNADGS
ncbi:VCBS domain-containing protein, partial [uncultured Ferrimonas sp.]|uniref:VCBS domain-containing protein n=1 Tax=uncultured Ferrimonas sp. TaxID=432640 RepID=UPI002626EA5A